MRILRIFDSKLLLTCVIAFAMCGCETKHPGNASGDYGSFGQPPTEQECQRFAEALQQAIEANKVAQADQQINYDAICDHSLAALNIADAPRTEIKTSAMKSIEQGNSIAAQVCSIVPSGVTYRFLRVRSRDGQKSVLFRLMGENTGLNYHEFILVKQADGQVRAVDVYLATSGEYLSETYRRGFACAAAGSAQASLGPAEAEFVRHIAEVQEMTSLIQQNKSEQALEVYSHWPSELKMFKPMLLARIRAAGGLDDRRYDEAINDFRNSYPNDPCLDFLLVDSYRIRNQMDPALEAVEKIDRSFGPDPYLNYLRSNFYLKARRYDDAIKAARKATEDEPTLYEGYWVQVEALLTQKNYDEVTKLLRILKDERKQSITRVRSFKGYAELANSPAYMAWTQQRNVP